MLGNAIDFPSPQEHANRKHLAQTHQTQKGQGFVLATVRST